MLLSELIEALQRNREVLGDVPVLLSRDSEGNCFSEPYSLSPDWYFEEDGELNLIHRNDIEVYKEDGHFVGIALVIWP